MEKINENRREELEHALQMLKGDNGRFFPAGALSNPEAAAHDSVVNALRIATNNECPEYLDRYDWDIMDEEERAEYAEEYVDFCYICDNFNDSVISKAIRDAEAELCK